MSVVRFLGSSGTLILFVQGGFEGFSYFLLLCTHLESTSICEMVCLFVENIPS